MKILMISPDQHNRYNWGWQLFRDEIARQNEIVADSTEADVVLLGDPKFLQDQDFSHIKKPKACIVGDYVDFYPNDPWHYIKRNNEFFNKNKIDIVFFTSQYSLDIFEKQKILWNVNKSMVGFVNGYSVDTNIFKPMDLERDIDVSMICNEFAGWCYPNRATIKKMISDEAKWNTLVGDKFTGPIHHDYVKALNRSKIFINSCSIFKVFSWKVCEALACGCFLLTDKPGDMLGYQDGKDLLLYDNLDDLKAKIQWALDSNGWRKSISLSGLDHVRKYHSNEVRAKEMIEKLEGIL